jgi:hypothetical protein
MIRAPAADRGSKRGLSLTDLCLVMYIAVGKRFQTKTLIRLASNHSDLLLGLTRHLHDLFMCVLPYQVSDHASDNG